MTWSGVMDNKFLMAFTGQMGFEPSDGIFSTFTTFLDWSVFDHLTSMISLLGSKIKYPPTNNYFPTVGQK